MGNTQTKEGQQGRKGMASVGKDLLRSVGRTREARGEEEEEERDQLFQLGEKVAALQLAGEKKKKKGYSIALSKRPQAYSKVKGRKVANKIETETAVQAPREAFPVRFQKWSTEDDINLKGAIEKLGAKSWKSIAEHVPNKTHQQCLQRWKKVLQPGLVKGFWNADEDDILRRCVERAGDNDISWTEISKEIPGRTPKQCRERWSLNLDPSINRSPWSKKEDELLLQLHGIYGNRWAKISNYTQGRTENAVKTRINSLQKKKAKEWSEEEDRILMESRTADKMSWVKISEKLPLRSKNSIKHRWKFLTEEMDRKVKEVLIYPKAEPMNQMPKPRPLIATHSGASTDSAVSGGVLVGPGYANQIESMNMGGYVPDYIDDLFLDDLDVDVASSSPEPGEIQSDIIFKVEPNLCDNQSDNQHQGQFYQEQKQGLQWENLQEHQHFLSQDQDPQDIHNPVQGSRSPSPKQTHYFGHRNSVDPVKDVLNSSYGCNQYVQQNSTFACSQYIQQKDTYGRALHMDMSSTYFPHTGSDSGLLDSNLETLLDLMEQDSSRNLLNTQDFQIA